MNKKNMSQLSPTEIAMLKKEESIEKQKGNEPVYHQFNNQQFWYLSQLLQAIFW